MEPVTVSPEVFLAMGREVLAKQPFSVLIGAELASLSPGRCELHVPVSDAVKQQHGFVHGGVLSYAADNALTYAGGTALRVPVVTAEFKINYLRPAVANQEIVCRAECHRQRGSMSNWPLGPILASAHPIRRAVRERSGAAREWGRGSSLLAVIIAAGRGGYHGGLLATGAP